MTFLNLSNSVKSIVFVSCVLLLLSCAAKQDIQYASLSEFDNDTTIIAPSAKVKLLAFSGSMDKNDMAIYYSQIICVNEVNGDTITVLCPVLETPSERAPDGAWVLPANFNPDKGVREATYARVDSTTELALNVMAKVETMPPTDKDTTTDLKSFLAEAASKPSLVAVNKTLPIFSRKHKTVIGVLKFASDIQ